MSRELIAQVIADTEHHVLHSADVAIHRSPAHVEQVLRPHLSRICALMSDPEQYALFCDAILALEDTNKTAATSLWMLVGELEDKGMEECINVCLGLESPGS